MLTYFRCPNEGFDFWKLLELLCRHANGVRYIFLIIKQCVGFYRPFFRGVPRPVHRTQRHCDRCGIENLEPFVRTATANDVIAKAEKAKAEALNQTERKIIVR